MVAQAFESVRERSSITGILKGGLGNQLFIYGAARALAHSLRTSTRVDASWFYGQVKRDCEMDSFDHDALVVHKESVVHQRLSHLRRRLLGNVYSEESFSYAPSFWELPVGTVLSGYFQSYRYLEPIALTLRQQVRRVRNPTNWFLHTSDHLSDLGHWISIHVRRGDYLDPEIHKVHGTVTRSYYLEALEFCRDRIGDLPVVVFSDDVELAQTEFEGQDREFTYLRFPPSARPIESLVLMSEAHASIIANSSFSWWGAWLSDYSGKCVVAPKRWFNNDSVCTADLIPAHWAQM